MNIISEEINWLAVIIATIVYSAFCGIWHRQFAFGKKWEKAMGFQRPSGWKETNIYFIVPLIACFVSTVAIALLLKLTNATSYSDSIKLGLILGIGFAMAIVFTTAVIPIMKKPLTFGVITGIAQAIGISLAAFIVYAISK